MLQWSIWDVTPAGNCWCYEHAIDRGKTRHFMFDISELYSFALWPEWSPILRPKTTMNIHISKTHLSKVTWYLKTLEIEEGKYGEDAKNQKTNDEQQIRRRGRRHARTLSEAPYLNSRGDHWNYLYRSYFICATPRPPITRERTVEHAKRKAGP